MLALSLGPPKRGVSPQKGGSKKKLSGACERVLLSFLRPCIPPIIPEFHLLLLKVQVTYLDLKRISPNLLPIPLIQLTFDTGAFQICLRSAPANAQYRALRVAISEGNHFDFYRQHCQTTAGVLQSRNRNFSPPPALRSICFGVPFTRQRPHSKGRPLSKTRSNKEMIPDLLRGEQGPH